MKIRPKYKFQTLYQIQNMLHCNLFTIKQNTVRKALRVSSPPWLASPVSSPPWVTSPLNHVPSMRSPMSLVSKVPSVVLEANWTGTHGVPEWVADTCSTCVVPPNAAQWSLLPQQIYQTVKADVAESICRRKNWPVQMQIIRNTNSLP